jgi:capsular exopolysaccharide synthesis family protein
MAKVYEALRRAEEERKRRTGDESSPVAPLDVQPVSTPPPARPEPFWKRWFTRSGRREAEGVGEINKRRIAMVQPDSYIAEQFRALRGRIDALASQRPIRTIMVTSPLAGEGKTTGAVNLAAVTAMSLGRRVLLIDCDMRRPRVHQSLGLRPEAGLAEVLTEETTLDQAIVKVEGMNLEVLAVRGRPSNPSELLGSAKMREILDELANRYDRVILDTPAALGVPDAKAVAELCDGIVMVVRADVTAHRDVDAALEILDRSRLLGVVLNAAHVDQGRYGYTG